MIYEIIIGVGVVLFLLWKYLPKRKIQHDYVDARQNEKVCPTTIENEETTDTVTFVSNETSKVVDDNSHNVAFVEDIFPQKSIVNIAKPEEVKEENFQNVKFHKRVSPPKERLAEFLEKTILNDDKLQSIIQNLSLDKTEFETEILPLNTKKDETLNKKLNGFHNTEEKPAINGFIVNSVKETERNKDDLDVTLNNNNNIENKPYLRRLQTQPAGLNFGSVIGELRSKTRCTNGAVKPVFRKFETDAVDNAQESLNSVDDKKKVHIDENELGPNILADRRNKLETAAQGWRKRVPQSDASLFTVAGRLERDKVVTPPAAPPAPPVPQLRAQTPRRRVTASPSSAATPSARASAG
ncbi:hypothetical protein RR46_09143 [Papilio xuthus]|uniref:Uncharacterized protein n=1 Tax=Papilio xuthus TaxID=66420 RepID=A0A194PV04_PAPXU|nr:hypothetical protein RR46_09143 [Papilio xuthus]